MVKRKGLPVQGELVFCTVQRITPYAAWCRLDEFENLEGMIHISEVAGKWIHDIREFIKPNKQYVAKVVRIDDQKGFINLSLKRVSNREEKQKINEVRKEQRAAKILEQAAQSLKKNLQQAYEEVGYNLQERFGNLFSAFEVAREEKEVLTEAGLSKQWIDALSPIIDKAFKEKEIILKAELELRSYAKDGVQKIKDNLKTLEKLNGIKIKYISAPRYQVELKTKDPKSDEKKLKDELEGIIKQIKQEDGEGSYRFVK